MAEIAKVSIKTPRFRIAAARSVIWIIGPFVQKQETADAISAVLLSWVRRGMRVSVK